MLVILLADIKCLLSSGKLTMATLFMMKKQSHRSILENIGLSTESCEISYLISFQELHIQRPLPVVSLHKIRKMVFH